MSSEDNGPEGQKARKKSTLLATAPLPNSSMVAPPQKASWHGKVFASIAVLGLLGGVYLATQGSGDPAQSTVATRTSSAVPTTSQSAEPVVVAEVAAPAIEVAPVVTEEPTVASVETADVQFIQPVDGASACESVIYDNLSGLQRAASESGTWDTHQDNVTKLVQDIINCQGTSFNVMGSFDELNDDRADLSVRWDASTKHLTLEMIDVGDAGPELVDAEASDAAFVLR